MRMKKTGLKRERAVVRSEGDRGSGGWLFVDRFWIGTGVMLPLFCVDLSEAFVSVSFVSTHIVVYEKMLDFQYDLLLLSQISAKISPWRLPDGQRPAS